MIRPVNIITEDVSNELEKIARTNAMPVSKFYVLLNSVTTFVKINDSEYMEASDMELEQYTQEKSLLDESIEFKQKYDVDILPHYEAYPFALMNCEVRFEKSDSFAYLVIKKGSRLNYSDDLYDNFLAFVDEYKLRNNIMFHIFETEYEKYIKQLVDVVSKVKTITFKEDKEILISKGCTEVKSVNAQVNMTIEDHVQLEEHDKVDHADRGFLISCSKGDDLFEFIKPVQGRCGRNTKGKIIEVDSVDLEAKPTFTVNDSIEVEDSFENIKFLSKKSGYLVKTDDEYEVSNSIDLDEISFKTTGTIDSDLDTEISINVVKNDPLEDAVEDGMHVRVQNISIEGSIGPHVKIEARTVSINGQTHDTASIQCIDATLSLHKGKVVARDVKIKALEGGEVIADKASVENASRGSVSAKNVSVKALGSHVTLLASESINIQRIRGEENTLIIDDAFSSGFDDKKDDDNEYVLKVKSELDEIQSLFDLSTKKLKNNLESCKKIKALIIKSKKEGLKLSQKVIENFKVCKVLQVRYKMIKDKVEYKKVQYDKIQNRLSLPGKTIFDSHIKLEQPLTGFNTIIYRLNKQRREIVLKVDKSMNKKVFKLIEDEDGVYKIINTN